MMIGASVKRRTDGNSVNPSTLGSITSRTMTSGTHSAITRNISAPSGTVRTENPA